MSDAELLSQLTALPEEAPDDFTCVVCERVATNRFHWSPRDFERPPICKSCESVSGYYGYSGVCHRTKPKGGTFRDRREAIRIDALADAIAQEANRQIWSVKYDRT